MTPNPRPTKYRVTAHRPTGNAMLAEIGDFYSLDAANEVAADWLATLERCEVYRGWTEARTLAPTVPCGVTIERIRF